MLMNSKKIFIGFVIAFIVALNIYYIPFDSNLNADTASEVPVDRRKIQISVLEDALNQALSSPVKINNYQHVVINFWATWCPSCRKENAIFNAFVQQNPHVLIVGVSVDRDINDYYNYLKTNAFNYPTIPNSKEIAVLFDDIVAVPTHFFINVQDGTVQKTMGLVDANELQSILRKNE